MPDPAARGAETIRTGLGDASPREEGGAVEAPRWVHGGHPERTRPRRGEEPPRTSTENRETPDRIDH